MIKERSIVERIIKVPQITYKNHNGIEIVEDFLFCKKRCQLKKEYILNFPSFALWTWLNESEFSRLIVGPGNELTIEHFFKLFNERHAIYKADLCFEIIDTYNSTAVLISKKSHNALHQLQVEGSEFLALDGLLNYSVEDFDADFESGRYNSNTVEI